MREQKWEQVNDHIKRPAKNRPIDHVKKEIIMSNSNPVLPTPKKKGKKA